MYQLSRHSHGVLSEKILYPKFLMAVLLHCYDARENPIKYMKWLNMANRRKAKLDICTSYQIK